MGRNRKGILILRQLDDTKPMPMKLAVAQFQPDPGNIPGNLEQHLVLIELAIEQDCSLILFPELSLTGYEPSLATELAMQVTDERLDVFQHLSNQAEITILPGLPLATPEGAEIGMAIFQPGQPRQTYAKQHLHADERPFFVPGNKGLGLKIGDLRLVPAICYESLLPGFIQDAVDSGCDLYLASVAKSAVGMDKAHAVFSEAARKYQMAILLSNCIGPNDNFIGGGKSAIWNNKGELAGQLDPTQTGILVLEMGE